MSADYQSPKVLQVVVVSFGKRCGVFGARSRLWFGVIAAMRKRSISVCGKGKCRCFWSLCARTFLTCLTPKQCFGIDVEVYFWLMWGYRLAYCVVRCCQRASLWKGAKLVGFHNGDALRFEVKNSKPFLFHRKLTPAPDLVVGQSENWHWSHTTA